MCLACGHLLPSTPGGWPCPSVFGERLSPLRPTNRPRRTEERSFRSVGRRDRSLEEFEAVGDSHCSLSFLSPRAFVRPPCIVAVIRDEIRRDFWKFRRVPSFNFEDEEVDFEM